MGLTSMCGRGLVDSLLTGIGLSAVGGSLAAAAAFVWGVPATVVMAVGGSVAGGMLGASVLGLLLPRVLHRFGLERRLPVGPLARAMAGVGAVTMFLVVARFLVR
jgi:hypothetical protein